MPDLTKTSASLHRSLRSPFLAWTIIIGSLLILFSGVFGEMLDGAADPLLINDDVRQHLAPLLRCADRQLFPHDRVMDYYSEAVHPVFFRMTYCALARTGIDPSVTSAAMPIFLLVVITALLGWTADRIGGRSAAWATMALSLGSPLFVERLAGGLERGFAFPTIAACVALLAAGRLKWLAATVVAAAGFYPPTAFVAGVSLSIAALLPGKEVRGDLASWTTRKRLLLLVCVAMLACLLMIPNLTAVRNWGARITPSMWAEYPEAGPDGRYPGLENRFGSWASLRSIGEVITGNDHRGGEPWLPGLPWPRPLVGIVSLMVWLQLVRRNPAAMRVSLLGLAAIVSATASVIFAPYVYIPQRFIIYPLPVLMIILLGTSISSVSKLELNASAYKRWATTAAIAGAVLVVVFAGSRGDGLRGLNVDLSRSERVLRFVGTLPPDSLVAGWPDGVIEAVPWLSRRSVLVYRESHEAFHEDYLIEMRRRMKGLVEAFYSTDPSAVRRLHEELGVDFVIVEPKLIYGSANYFSPFDQWITDARANLGQQTPALQKVDHESIVFRDGNVFVVKLADVDADGS